MVESRLLTERLVGHDLHSDLRSGDDGVVGVGLEARVHATLNGVARGVKGRLGDGVVLRQELEDDDVANGDVLELIGLVGQASGTANLDGVSSSGDGSCAGGSLLAGLRGRSAGSLGGSAAGDDGDLLVDDGGLSAATGVGPDDDDVGLGLGGDAVALHAVGESGSATLEDLAADDLLADGAGHGERRKGQSDGGGELHGDKKQGVSRYLLVEREGWRWI